jgi:hypothetical protein
MTTSTAVTRLTGRHAQERLPHVIGVAPLLVVLRILYTLVMVLAFAIAIGGVVGYGLTVALDRLFAGG